VRWAGGGVDDDRVYVFADETVGLQIARVGLIKVSFLEGDIFEVVGIPDLDGIGQGGTLLDTVNQNILLIWTQFSGEFGVEEPVKNSLPL
jgi:hypothetical protein